MFEFGVTRALFAGDDLTDEEAFHSLDHARVMTIRVGRSARSSAEYYLRSQNEIDDLLDIVGAVRPSHRSPSDAGRTA